MDDLCFQCGNYPGKICIKCNRALKDEVKALRKRIEQLELERDLAWDVVHVLTSIAQEAIDDARKMRSACRIEPDPTNPGCTRVIYYEE